MSSKKKVAKIDSQFVVFLRSFSVGAVSATIAKTLCAPIERIKIILQVQAKHPDIAAEQKATGIVNCAVKVFKDAPKGTNFFMRFAPFWRGNGTNVLRYFPMQAVNFACKSRYKTMFIKKGRKYGGFDLFLRTMAAGGAAGATGLTVVYPLDFARTRLTSDISSTRQYKGILDCLYKSFRYDGGIPGIYRGYLVSIAGIIPYRACYFGLYDTAKKYVFKGKADEFSFWAKWAVSQTTSVASQFAAYPFDTIRRRMHVNVAADGKTKVYKSSWDCTKKLLAEEGFAALYMGMGANVLRATGAALCLVFYDTIGKMMFGDKDYGAQ